jgi:hypothetical protein
VHVAVTVEAPSVAVAVTKQSLLVRTLTVATGPGDVTAKLEGGVGTHEAGVDGLDTVIWSGLLGVPPENAATTFRVLTAACAPGVDVVVVVWRGAAAMAAAPAQRAIADRAATATVRTFALVRIAVASSAWGRTARDVARVSSRSVPGGSAPTPVDPSRAAQACP